ncbi:MAG: glucose-6-phosphate isomerase [Prevotella sp.]|jgi:glucose-6-phosphate isomerase|nr:glucose-6-phosphate isomerase [Prevotella sp.]
MRNISLDITKAAQFLPKGAVESLEPKAKAAQEALENGTCAGNDFLGWLHLPSQTTDDFLNDIEACAEILRSECDTVVVAGIGGSYLGARAVIEALGNSLQWLVNDTAKTPNVIFAGNSISEDYLAELTEYLKDKRFGVINISKSGTTTETALTFRLLKKQCEAQRGKETAKKVIVAITDAVKGAARKTAEKEGYQTFVIPDNVGGRFSVLTPVGLLPIAVAGFDIKAIIKGAQDMEAATANGVAFADNIAEQYAVARQALYTQLGKKIEIIANFQPKLHFIAEWWKQLYGESEGKDGKGIFPAACDFTTDLHSMGQWIQQGERSIFETVLSVEEPNRKLLFPHDDENLDGLNFLEGKRVDEVNKMAELGTRLAHVDGGVPNIRVCIPQLNEYYLGQLIYFFEKACGISGLMEGVNPFNQPGVEAYKKNMFALLGKPGYEADTKAIKERLAKEQ